jgi:hypothetical protein
LFQDREIPSGTPYGKSSRSRWDAISQRRIGS